MTLDWFRVPRTEMFLIGVPLTIDGVGTGYERALAHAKDALAAPHLPVNLDLLTAECNELAESMVKIAQEDGDAMSLANVFRTMILEAARRESTDSR